MVNSKIIVMDDSERDYYCCVRQYDYENNIGGVKTAVEKVIKERQLKMKFFYSSAYYFLTDSDKNWDRKSNAIGWGMAEALGFE